MDSQQPSVKQRFKQAGNQNVSIDYFLYSCWEQDRTLKALPAHVRPTPWPRLQELEELAGENLGDLLHQMLDWYVRNNRDISTYEPINHERLSVVGPIVVQLVADLGRLAELNTGKPLTPITPEVAANDPTWRALEEAVRDAFPRHADLYLAYLEWTFRDDIEEEEEPGSRPPVGKYAPLLRSRGGRPGGGPGGSGGGRGRDQQRGPQGGGRGRGGESRNHQGRGRRDEGSDQRGPRRANFGNHQDHQQGGRSQHRGGRGGFGRPNPEHDPEKTAQLTEAAIREVDQAISQMEQNRGLADFAMRPTNSFYRRIQHEHIKKAGYFSTSVGEGSDRAVLITRAASDVGGE